jgi:hypothetical protein
VPISRIRLSPASSSLRTRQVSAPIRQDVEAERLIEILVRILAISGARLSAALSIGSQKGPLIGVPGSLFHAETHASGRPARTIESSCSIGRCGRNVGPRLAHSGALHCPSTKPSPRRRLRSEGLFPATRWRCADWAPTAQSRCCATIIRRVRCARSCATTGGRRRCGSWRSARIDGLPQSFARRARAMRRAALKANLATSGATTWCRFCRLLTSMR